MCFTGTCVQFSWHMFQSMCFFNEIENMLCTTFQNDDFVQLKPIFSVCLQNGILEIGTKFTNI